MESAITGMIILHAASGGVALLSGGVAQVKVPNVSQARTKKKKTTKNTKRKTKSKTRKKTTSKTKERKKMSDVTLLPAATQPQALIPSRDKNSLTAWLSLYMKIDGEACAEQTRIEQLKGVFNNRFQATSFGFFGRFD